MKSNLKPYMVSTDSGSKKIWAWSVKEAYTRVRSNITPAMFENGAYLWVEPVDKESDEMRITMGIDAD